MKSIVNPKENGQNYIKRFETNGDIEEGEVTELDGSLIKGIRWKLKKNGTYDRFKVKREVSKEDGELGEEFLTFICNEELWMIIS